MGNSFPSPIVPPDPLRFTPGRKLLAADVDRLATSFNYGHAWFGASTCVAQGFDTVASSTAAMPAAGTYHGQWRIRKLGSAWTSVEVEIRATKAGAGDGTVRFESVNGGDTITLTVPAGTTAWVSDTLDVAYDATAFWEEIRMSIAGAGGAATTVHEVFVNYVPLTSALATSGSDGFTPLDTDEVNADSVCSSRIGIYMRDNLRTFLGDDPDDPDADLATYPGRYRHVYNWSDLGSIKSGMTNHDHRVLRPLHYGALTNAHSLKIWVKATGVVGASKVWIYHGDARGEGVGHPSFSGGRSTSIDVGAGAAVDWYEVDIALDDAHHVIGAWPHPTTHLSIWPGIRDYGDIGNFGPIGSGRQQNSGDDSPTIHAVSAWSY